MGPQKAVTLPVSRAVLTNTQNLSQVSLTPRVRAWLSPKSRALRGWVTAKLNSKPKAITRAKGGICAHGTLLKLPRVQLM
jgi:hypothetical protein